MDYGHISEVKTLMDVFQLLSDVLTDGLWIIVMFYQTLILTAPIHCNVMQ